MKPKYYLTCTDPIDETQYYRYCIIFGQPDKFGFFTNNPSSFEGSSYSEPEFFKHQVNFWGIVEVYDLEELLNHPKALSFTPESHPELFI